MSDFYRDKKNKALTFIKKKGLYVLIAVLLFGVSVAVICIFINRAEPKEKPLEKPQTLSPSKPNKEDAVLKPQEVSEIPENPEKLIFSPPVYCNISHDFSGSVPVFSESMNDWRLHQGVDYSTEEPLEVKACAEGIVEDVYFDGLMGQTVVILHPDETKTVYQSLSETVKVIKGQTVRAGDVIGMTSDTAVSEADRNVHLHFAVIREGRYIDPKTLFN